MVDARLTQIAGPGEPVFLEKDAISHDIAGDGEGIA
jgi:hypothetical protein